MSKNTGTSELINYFDLGANGDVGIAGSLDINTIANATTDTDTFLVSDTGIIKYRTGAQLLSDIGGQAAGNYVTTDTSQAITANKSFTVGFSLGSEGSGNQTSFFRNTSSLFSGSGGTNIFGFNNSNNIYFGKGLNNGGVLQWNNTTATRYYTLPDADGTIALTSAIPANPIGGTGTSGTIPVFTGSTTIGNSIIQSNATQVNVVGNGSQLLFDSLGSAKDGGIQYVNDFTLQMYNSRGVGSSIYLGNNNLDLNINPSSNPRLRITSGGNVLVNTTTDNGARLQVSGTATISSALTSSDLTIKNSANAETLDLFLSPSTFNGFIDYPSGRSLTIRNKGSLGSLVLAATGAATFSSSVTTDSLFRSNQGILQLFAAGGFRGGLYTYNQWAGTGTDYSPTVASESDIYFATAGSITKKMTITSGGNVLIGTTTDAGYKLDVNGTIRSLSATPLVVSMTSNPGNHAIIAARWTSGVGMDMSYFPDFAQGFIDNTYQVTAGQPYGDIYFRQNVSGTMTPRMTIKADGGRVGIGTTNPAGRLSVNDAVYGEYLRVATGVIGGNQTSVYLAWNNAGNITLQQVTVGAADSGGSGFRLLRIPNT